MTTYDPMIDPMAAAMNPQVQTQNFAKTYFGKAKVAASFVSLVKGQGRVPWEPNQLTPEGKPTQKLTGIDIQIECTSKEGQPYSVDRNYIAEFGNGEWVTITLPSLKEAGIMGLQDLNGRFVEVDLVPTGETYVQKATGETKEKTTFKFVRLFKDQAEMDAVRAAKFAGDTSAQAAAPAPAQPPAASAAPVDPNQETARKFLEAYVKNAYAKAGGDLIKTQEVLAPMISQQALLAKYFTVHSPEVMELIGKQVPF